VNWALAVKAAESAAIAKAALQSEVVFVVIFFNPSIMSERI
jgi:hypothetical protein